MLNDLLTLNQIKKRNMNRKQIIAQIIERISVMEQNDYLLPQTWSDTIDMTFCVCRTYQHFYRGVKNKCCVYDTKCYLCGTQ